MVQGETEGSLLKADKAQICSASFITNTALEGACEDNDDNFKSFEKKVTFKYTIDFTTKDDDVFPYDDTQSD